MELPGNSSRIINIGKLFRAYSLDYIALLNKEKQGNWDEAHQQIQPYSDLMACLIHGYLHRVEGDLDNAQYWYNRADTNIPDNTLEQEWQRLYELAHSD